MARKKGAEVVEAVPAAPTWLYHCREDPIIAETDEKVAKLWAAGWRDSPGAANIVRELIVDDSGNAE
ncbi:MAG: hypothetical protein D6773_19785 [Alphaproteobacteria bacterium]|nr:MAG: hypothetical protein D6773_19785 [Alphaproteobacteria bacterium]